LGLADAEGEGEEGGDGGEPAAADAGSSDHVDFMREVGWIGPRSSVPSGDLADPTMGGAVGSAGPSAGGSAGGSGSGGPVSVALVTGAPLVPPPKPGPGAGPGAGAGIGAGSSKGSQGAQAPKATFEAFDYGSAPSVPLPAGEGLGEAPTSGGLRGGAMKRGRGGGRGGNLGGNPYVLSSSGGGGAGAGGADDLLGKGGGKNQAAQTAGAVAGSVRVSRGGVIHGAERSSLMRR
jgi:hypothetical protein